VTVMQTQKLTFSPETVP